MLTHNRSLFYSLAITSPVYRADRGPSLDYRHSQQVAEPGFEPRSPDCQAQGSFFSTPDAPPWGPHTLVSEQRWAGLQVSLLPEPRAVLSYVQIKEALPPPLRASSMFVINLSIWAATPGASGTRRQKAQDTVERSGRWKPGADRPRFVLNPCLTAHRGG